ncbi:MAG: DNA polymerase [Acidimicrobiales bacterium]
MGDAGAEVLQLLQSAGVGRGSLVAIAVGRDSGLGLAVPGGATSLGLDVDRPADVVARVDQELRPRWVMWSGDTALALVQAGVRVATSWDVAAVHRLLDGGWRADPARVWAWARGLPSSTIPVDAPVDLFHQVEDEVGGPPAIDPIGPDGHLRPRWVSEIWSSSPAHLEQWARLAGAVAERQLAALAALDEPGRSGTRPMAAATARSESAAELLCAEMTVDGLPMDREVAEHLIAGFVGPRPRSAAEAEELARARQSEVLAHAPAGADFDLRSPAQVKALLGLLGIDVPDTRAWRLETLRGVHPIVEPLLAWRKAERISTTYGYAWLDENLGADGRLRGAWTASDGAAGRMTASAGLHNMPAVMRQAVVAEPDHVFVRADLGQIEPRVLAAVSQDPRLARATLGDDLYAPVAAQLGVDRATAKVAVLGAMYGQTTGHGARALRGLEAAYPVAMAYLEAGDRAGQRGEDLRTYGGRRIRMGSGAPAEGEDRSRAAARGRYGRNALVQGAAAELFKVWAVTVRARGAALDARVVLCLHDELLVHAPAEHGDAVGRLVDDALQEAAHRWAPDDSVRFVADSGVIERWSDAKA